MSILTHFWAKDSRFYFFGRKIGPNLGPKVPAVLLFAQNWVAWPNFGPARVGVIPVRVGVLYHLWPYHGQPESRT